MARAALISVTMLVCFAISAPACGDEVDRIVTAEMQRQYSPAVAIAIVKKGNPVKVQSYGIANLEDRAPATSATFFQTGSIGKQFTATLVMLLVRDGKLKLDEPVSTYLPATPPSWSGITVRRLLTHTAGLRGTDPAIDLRKDYTEDELLSSAYKASLLSTPGLKYAYSNLGYQVLGVLCSKVDGRFWGDQMRERVFVPLGMSARVISERDIVPNRAAGYERFEGQLENQQWVAPSQNTTADGSLYVSAQDMARWGTALQGTQILSAAEKDAMWTPAILDGGLRTDYGFGWELEQKAGHRIVLHRGDWQGFTSFIMHLPDDRLTITVLMNRANGQPQKIASQIVGTFIHELRKPVASAPSESDLHRQPVYLRRPASDGKPPVRFVEINPGRWQSNLTLAPGMHQFRIGDASVVMQS
jgi:CubicO group peptidase (beta-lactamase class C family)